MKLPSITSHTHHRRKIHYIDETLQKYLLIGIVVIEAGLTAVLTWVMYWRLNQIVEDNLYRVHFAEAAPMINQLMHEALLVLWIFSVVNLIALLVVDFIWRRYVYSILRLFMELVGKTYRLDFTADPEIRNRHQILDLTEIQREQDRARLTKIREQLSRLDLDMQGVNDVRAMHDALNALDELLPQPAAISTSS